MSNLPDDFDHRAFEARFGDPCTRDLSNIAASYCIAKLAYAAGEDEAGDGAWSRFVNETHEDEREQIEAQLECEYPGMTAWVACLVDAAEANARDVFKAKVVFAAMAAIDLFAGEVMA